MMELPSRCLKEDTEQVDLIPIPRSSIAVSMSILFLLLLLLFFSSCCHAQQLYTNNKQYDCSDNSSSTLGYVCNGPRSCSSFLTFRSTTVYSSSVLIAYILAADASNISRINGVNDVVSTFPDDQIVLVPLPCSCSGGLYQHNASFTVRSSDTYFLIVNETYQGLTTCQALMAQNSYNPTNLSVFLRLNVPVRCACPTADQARSGIRYLLNYLVIWGDDIATISARFRADEQAVRDANNLSADAIIFPFTTLLVPLTSEPTRDLIVTPAAAPSPPQPAGPPPGSGSSSTNKGVFIGVGSGVGCNVMINVINLSE